MRTRTLESQTTAVTAARAALEKQAEQVVILDLRGLSTVTDFFVLCTADNARQLSALNDHIEAGLAQLGVSVWHTEGMVAASVRGEAFDAPQWLLMDCGEVVVHLLDRRARAFYRLEDLWADAPRIPVPNL